MVNFSYRQLENCYDVIVSLLGSIYNKNAVNMDESPGPMSPTGMGLTMPQIPEQIVDYSLICGKVRELLVLENCHLVGMQFAEFICCNYGELYNSL